jgi:BirA family biotin operon repressor/biotin-[acetyl-CoA-carboxylase] ligase
MNEFGTTQHHDWGAEGLWRQLSPLLPGLDVEVLARCESTNSALLQRARAAAAGTRRQRGQDAAASGRGQGDGGRRADDAAPWLLVAEHQTAGRGRLGRPWTSAPGASLTFSLALAMAPRDWSGLSLAVGVALADALESRGGNGTPHLGLKWPNDLWWRDAPGHGRKLGGILIETTAIGDHRIAVIGIGLDVLPLSDRQTDAWASLQELLPGITAPQVLHRVALPLVQALQRFEHEGFTPFAPAYAARDLLAGQEVTTTAPEAPAGRVLGVAADGALRLLTPHGEQRITSGEVSVRLREAGA